MYKLRGNFFLLSGQSVTDFGNFYFPIQPLFKKVNIYQLMTNGIAIMKETS